MQNGEKSYSLTHHYSAGGRGAGAGASLMARDVKRVGKIVWARRREEGMASRRRRVKGVGHGGP
jgi:hypothetical protein